MNTPFSDHVLEALHLNRARAPLYAAQSGGQSRGASRRLITLERMILPIARWMDARFGAAGEPAFVAMDAVRAPEVAPEHRSGGSWRAWWAAQRALGAFAAQVAPPCWEGDAAAVLAGCHATLGRLADLERVHRVHLAMSAHLVESVGRAMWAETPAARRALSLLQLVGLSLGPGVDRRAWRAHAVGVGVVLNDLPPIPLSDCRWAG